jgi:hypothetical protein
MLVYLALGVAVAAVLGMSSNVTFKSTGAMVAMLAAVAFVLPGMHVSHALIWSGSHISVDGDDMTVSVRDSDNDISLHLEVNGELRFNEAEDDIAYLAPRSRLEIAQELDGVDHELVITSDRDGELTYEYERDDVATPFEDGGREWLAVAIPYIYRATGLQAEERVGWIHENGGPDAVLAEIELIDGDYIQRIYYSELVVLTGTDDALADVYRHAGRQISSDYELRQLLSALPTRSDLSRDQSSAILEAASQIGSDFELATLLVGIADQLDPHPSIAMAYLDAARSIDSDFEMNKALDALAAVSWIDRVPVDVMFEASEDIGSDFELAGFLIDSAELAVRDEASLAAFFAAAETIGSDYEMSRLLQRLALVQDLDADALLGMIELSDSNISSDYEHSQVLMALAPRVEGDPALVRAYERAAERLGQHQYGQAMRALVSAR